MEFHGIPWNCSSHRNWRTQSSMEFHGTARVIEIGAPNFHGIPWNCSCHQIGALLVPWNSMELLVSAKLAHSKFHGIPQNSMELLVSAKLEHSKFHGIPWNFSCQRNWRTPSSMEFHGIPWNCSSHRNWRTQSSMEFHGTALVIEIGALLVPWNSMELLVSAKLAHSKFHGIPWNFSCQRNWRTPNSMEFHGTARVIEIGALLVPWNSMELLLSSKLAHY